MLLGCEAWHKTGEILRGGLIYFRLAASSSVCGLFLLIFYMDAFLEITGVNFCCSDLLCFIYFLLICVTYKNVYSSFLQLFPWSYKFQAEHFVSMYV